MKILILQEDYPPQALGGAGVVVASLVEEYANLGAQVCVVTSVQDKSKAGSSTQGRIRVERFYSDYNNRWRAWRCLYNSAGVSAVKKALADFVPDAVHAHNVHAHISYHTLRLAKQSGAKVLLTAHDVQAFNYGKLINYKSYKVSALRQLQEQGLRYNPFRNVVIRRILRGLTVVAVSQALADALAENGIKAQATVRNGIEASWWANDEGASIFKQKYGIGERAILFSGGSYLKGTQQMLDAFALVRQKMQDAQLVVVGRSQAEGDGIVSAGWLSREELRAAYHAISVVAVPSICFDSFPTVNLEAGACGKAVVATGLGGSREAIQEGTTGYIIDPFNTELFAQKLEALLLGEARTMGEAARARVGSEFTLAGQAAKYLEFFA